VNKIVTYSLKKKKNLVVQADVENQRREDDESPGEARRTEGNLNFISRIGWRESGMGEATRGGFIRLRSRCWGISAWEVKRSASRTVF